MPNKQHLQRILSTFVLLIMSLFILLPIWSMLRLSFDGSIKSAPVEFSIFPKEFTLEVYRKVITNPSQSLSLLGLIRNSLVVSFGSAISAVLLGTTMAYAFARMRFPGRRIGLFGILLGALLPIVALMTPLYIILTAIGIRSSLIGLMIVYTSFAMPFCIWNMRNSFQAVSVELEEAAYIDGANHLITFLRITLPIALPSIAVAALVAFLAGYTEFAIGWLFIENSAQVTLAMTVWGMLTRATWSEIAALSILMSIPVILIFIVLQRYLLEHLLIGGSFE